MWYYSALRFAFAYPCPGEARANGQKEVQRRMIKYEMGVIVRVDLPDDGFTLEMDKVKALIERFGGTIDKIDEWGRRRLAYPIEKQTEGMYTFITYTAESFAPKEIESRIRLIENVLRFLTVRKDEVEAGVIAPPAVEEPVPETAEEAPAVEEAPVVEEAPAAEEAPIAEEEPAAGEEPVVEPEGEAEDE
jgi:small subunit ribosomal protein S6